ncbi:MAG: mannitol dehydrogenase family protein [Succinivibrio sp.]
MELTLASLKKDRAAFEKAGIALPRYDAASLMESTPRHPSWVHMGAGNIFHGFIASIAQDLLNKGLMKSGILAVSAYDGEAIRRVGAPHDHLKLNVTLLPDGSKELEVLASVPCEYLLNGTAPSDMAAVRGFFREKSLQMMSFTITEKGYALRDMRGDLLPQVQEDLKAGPEKCRSAMALATALLLERYRAGGYPIALVSMDNCSHNGSKLKAAVEEIARAWAGAGFADQGFVSYIGDPLRVSFPWTMIDKITPRPDPQVARELAAIGLEGMEPLKTARGSFIAPFVNAEKPGYLVIEDSFPAGRPPLEKAGVLFTDAKGVDLCERMKVTVCLNPLHTALAVYGCLLGYKKISDEMDDPLLAALVRRLGCVEGLKVVDDPKIISPEAFLNEVLTQRLVNRCLPDTPQRIATDTSMKVPVRFGETLKNYQKRGLDASGLVALPLARAGWLRYLMGVGDDGRPMELSDDPQIPALKEKMQGIVFGKPETVGSKLEGILGNAQLFGVDLCKAGLGGKIEGYFKEEIAGPGAVRATLSKELKA